MTLTQMNGCTSVTHCSQMTDLCPGHVNMILNITSKVDKMCKTSNMAMCQMRY